MNEEREVLVEIITGLVVAVVLIAVCMVIMTLKYRDLQSKYENLAVRCKRIETEMETMKSPKVDGLILEEGDK